MTTLQRYQELKTRNAKLRASIRSILLGASPEINELIAHLSDVKAVGRSHFERAEIENSILRKQVDALLVISQDSVNSQRLASYCSNQIFCAPASALLSHTSDCCQRALPAK